MKSSRHDFAKQMNCLRRASRGAVTGLAVIGIMALTACTDDETSAGKSITPPPGDAVPVVAATDTKSSSPAVQTSAVELPPSDGETDVSTLMSDLSLPDVITGDPNAPITIVEYASMTCDHCAAFHMTTYPVIKKNYLDTGKAKLIIREFPFDPRATAAFMLARCAPNGKREAMIDVLFRQGEQWAHSENASAKLLSISKLAGFTEESFKACLSDKDLQAKVTQTMQRGQEVMGVDSTPTFFINGTRYKGALKPDQMSAILDSKL